MPTPSSLAAVVALAAALAACGASPVVRSDPASPPALRGLKVLGCDTGIRVEFVAALDPRSVNAQSLFVEQVTGTTSYDPTEGAATFRPEEPFVSGDPYVAVLGADLLSSGGTALGEPVRWQFSCIDRTPPVVASRLPQGEGASTLVQPTVRFSEAMDVTSLTVDTVHLAGVDANPVYDAARHEVALVPRRPLYPGRTYTVVVSSKVRDVSGNALGTEVRWSFRTRPPVDDWAARPVTPPLPDAAPCDTPIELRLAPDFDLDVAALADAPLAVDGAPDVAVEYDPARRILRVEPTVPLRPGGSYAVHATAALRDRMGDRPFDVGAQLFTVVVLATCDEPTLAQVGDADGQLACTSPTSVRFSVPMDPETTLAAVALGDLTAGGYDPNRAVAVEARATLSDDHRSVTLQPATALTSGHRYLVQVAATARGADGRPLHAGGRWELAAVCP